MSITLKKRLALNEILLADGATGTNLFALGLQSGDAPELWNESEIDKIESLYAGAVNAGSDIFLTNSFGANRARLKLHGAQDRAYELSARSVDIARNVVKKAQRDVFIAGSIGPLGELMGDIGSLTHDDAVEIFYETAHGLIEAGADFLWVETISALEELKAAHDAIEKLNAPWCATMSFDSSGRTMMGVTPKAYVEWAETLSHAPLAIGANCGVGASDLLRSITTMRHSQCPLIAKGNAGIPKFVNGHIHYDGTPALMADYAILAARAGASIIGGCCGTTAHHLTKMRAALDLYEGEGDAPSLAEIEEKMGAFSSLSDGSEEESAGRQKKRRTRRKAA